MNRCIILICFLILFLGKANAQPKFKGGDNALSAFLIGNLVYPEYSRQNCISGVIQISFNLDKAGKVYHVKVHKGLGIDLDDEAMRVVKLTSGKWIVPEGYNTNENVILPIRFRAEETRCQTMNPDNITAAIEAYRSREELVNVVTNYYSNKYLGKVDTSKEPLVEALKKQLGFDDEYIDRIMKQAALKLKEGDREGACDDWNFIKNIGSNKADNLLARYCR